MTGGADNNGGGQGQDNPGQDGSGEEEDEPSDDGSWKTFGVADKQARVSDDKPTVYQPQPCRHAFSQASPPVVPNNSPESEVESEVGDLGNTPSEQAKRETATPASVSRLDPFQKKQLEGWLLCRQCGGL